MSLLLRGGCNLKLKKEKVPIEFYHILYIFLFFFYTKSVFYIYNSAYYRCYVSNFLRISLFILDIHCINTYMNCDPYDSKVYLQ